MFTDVVYHTSYGTDGKKEVRSTSASMEALSVKYAPPIPFKSI